MNRQIVPPVVMVLSGLVTYAIAVNWTQISTMLVVWCGVALPTIAPDPVDALQWPASVVALVGAWWVGADQPDRRFWGFIGFLLSNLLWVAWASHSHAWALLGMQALFTATSLRGMVQNYRAHALASCV